MLYLDWLFDGEIYNILITTNYNIVQLATSQAVSISMESTSNLNMI